MLISPVFLNSEILRFYIFWQNLSVVLLYVDNIYVEYLRCCYVAENDELMSG